MHIKTLEEHYENNKALAFKLTRETHQKFLDYMWSGKSFGETIDALGISMEEGNGIMRHNTITRLSTVALPFGDVE